MVLIIHRNFLVVVLSLFVFVALIESLAWLYFICFDIEQAKHRDYFETTTNHLRFDPVLGWSLKPGSLDANIQINSLGFRASLNDFDKECSDKKVVLLPGDSMLLGLGMPQDQIFSEILNRYHMDCCFVNTGVEGYSTVQEYYIAQKYFTWLTPDLVILFYTQENDMLWNARDGNFNPHVIAHRDSLVFMNRKGGDRYLIIKNRRFTAC